MTSKDVLKSVFYEGKKVIQMIRWRVNALKKNWGGELSY